MSARLHQHNWIFHVQLSKWLHIIRIQLYWYEYDDYKAIFLKIFYILIQHIKHLYLGLIMIANTAGGKKFCYLLYMIFDRYYIAV